ncbi:MAG: DUF2256 domain-containing protein [Paracoccaceae bacterium]
MPRGVAKGDLPQKTCATCGRPFAWRKKWAKVWDEVRYCSDRCRRERPKGGSDKVALSDA